MRYSSTFSFNVLPSHFWLSNIYSKLNFWRIRPLLASVKLDVGTWAYSLSQHCEACATPKDIACSLTETWSAHFQTHRWRMDLYLFYSWKVVCFGWDTDLLVVVFWLFLSSDWYSLFLLLYVVGPVWVPVTPIWWDLFSVCRKKIFLNVIQKTWGFHCYRIKMWFLWEAKES